MFNGVSDAVDYRLWQLLPGQTPQRYCRLQTALVIGNDDMDDASNTNLLAQGSGRGTHPGAHFVAGRLGGAAHEWRPRRYVLRTSSGAAHAAGAMAVQEWRNT
jgi:hypothetical protein